MSAIMMRCGCAANGRDVNGKPVCVNCAGIRPGWDQVAETASLPTERTAICGDCGKIVPSSVDLPFFASHPGLEHDTFYDGCRGMD